MIKHLFVVLLCSLPPLCVAQNPKADSATRAQPHLIDHVVITGARQKTDVRLLPMTVSVVPREKLEQNFEQSVLPALSRRVPGLFVTQRGIDGDGSYNTFQAEATNTVRKGGFSSVVSGSYNRTDGHRKDMGYDQYGGYAKLGYRFSPHWKLWGDVNLTHFNAENPGSLSSPLVGNIAHITRGMTSVAVENDYGKSSGTLGFFYNWGHHKINDGHAPGASPKDFYFASRDKMLGVSWYQTFSLFKGNRLTTGIDYQHFGGRARNVFTDDRPVKVTADKSMHEVAGYVDFRQQLCRWLVVDAGLRYDHHSHSGNEWVPQGGVAVLLPHDAQLKAMVSKGFRFPTIREMFMFPPQNPDLKAEKLMNYELSFKQCVAGGRLAYGVNVFFIKDDNMIQVVPVEGRPTNINTGEVENAGVEAEISWAISPSWSVEANYSYLHLRYPIAAAPEHKLYTGVSFHKGRWNASTDVMYVEGLITRVKPMQEDNFVLWNARFSFRVTRWLPLFAKGENLLAQSELINAGFPMLKAMGSLDINF